MIDGPLEARRCTDFIFLILYLVSFIGMLTIEIISYLDGNPLRLTAAYDPDCNIMFLKIP